MIGYEVVPTQIGCVSPLRILAFLFCFLFGSRNLDADCVFCRGCAGTFRDLIMIFGLIRS